MEAASEGIVQEAGPEISPDGRWMAYQSDESGKPEVYVRPFPDVNKGKSTGFHHRWGGPVVVA